MSRLPCQPSVARPPTASTAAKASSTVSGFGTLALSRGERSAVKRARRGKPAAMQKADKAAQHRQTPCQRASFGMELDATGEIGAEVGGPQPIDRGKARQLSQMLGQEVEEQCEVAPVSGDGVGRRATLAGQPSGPQSDRRTQVGGRRKPRQRHRFRRSWKIRLLPGYRPRSSHWAMVISSARARKVRSSVPRPG